MDRVKIQLRKLLAEKEENSLKIHEKKVGSLIRLEGKARKDLSALRYRQEEIRIKEEFKGRNKSTHIEKTALKEDLNLPILSPISYTTLTPQPEARKELQQLSQQEQEKTGQLNTLHSKIADGLSNNCSLRLSRDLLQAEIRTKERGITDYVDH